MSELQRQDTLTKALVAALGVTTIIAKSDDRDDQTVRGLSLESNPVLVDTSIFDVLSEFKLELILSPPASPTPSASNLPPSTPSPPLSPTLSRSFSFTSAKAATATKKSMKKSSKLSSTAPARSRGSWPLIRYTGRGTPVDRRRRLEWGGFSTEDVAEDGLLFSQGIRYSDDSTSPESPSAASSASHSSHTHSAAKMEPEPSIYEPPPEIGPLEIESCSARRSEEWDHIMKSVLATTAEEDPDIEETQTAAAASKTPAEEESHQVVPLNFCIMSKEQVEELNSGLEAELGLHSALDLGFGREPSNSKWFGVNPHQIAASSRASSPSVYSSQAITLRKRSHTSDPRSASSTKAEADTTGEVELKLVSSNPWWRRMFGRFRRVQNLFHFP